jgi:large subunit ribosomal protein L27Ae
MASKDNAPLIDVTQFSYFKVLENGVLQEKLFIVVKAKLISNTVEKKSGRSVVLLFSLLRFHWCF